MSLLADLLAKVKFQGTKGAVPPNLKQLVSDSSEKAAARKRFAVLFILILLAVVSGFGAVYMAEFYLKPAAQKTPRLPEKTAQEQPAGKSPALPAAPEGAAALKSDKSRNKPLSVSVIKKSREKDKAAGKKEYGHPAGQAEKIPASQQVNSENKKMSDAASSEREAAKQRQREDVESRDVYIYAAGTAESKKDYQQALVNYKKALETDSANYIIMNNIASLMLRTGSYSEAVSYSKNALSVKKDYVPSLINLGIAQVRLNNNTEGESYLSKALSIEASNKHALLNLAILYERTGDFEKAQALYRKLSEMRDVQGHFGIARISEKKGKKSDAAGVYREILSITDMEPQFRRLANERLLMLEQ